MLPDFKGCSLLSPVNPFPPIRPLTLPGLNTITIGRDSWYSQRACLRWVRVLANGVGHDIGRLPLSVLPFFCFCVLTQRTGLSVREVFGKVFWRPRFSNIEFSLS